MHRNSKTGDPLGEYHLYDFQISFGCLNDYPKLGVWNDAYYLTANEFCGTSFTRVIAVAFERERMLVGSSAARFVRFELNPTSTELFFSVQPSHWGGGLAPAPGTPNLFVMAFDSETHGVAGAPDGYRLWAFSVNWSNPSLSTFTSLGQVNTPEFDSNLCNFGPCVPQPAPGSLLRTLSNYTMYRVQYRRFPAFQALVGNHTVDADGNNTAGVRWFDLRKFAADWELNQAGTYAPADGRHRWMGSIGMDGLANIALAFSRSGTGSAPSIAYTWRTEDDPPGQMSGNEVTCVSGSGVQTGDGQTQVGRWGDYSTVSVGFPDDCSFWLTNEYYETNGTLWKTRICSFHLPACSGPPPGGGGSGGTHEFGLQPPP